MRNGREGNKILIVEDDYQIAKLLADTLTENGMVVDIASDGSEMDMQRARNEFDLVILDVMLPGEDGLSLCRRLRTETTVPILMLTALGHEIDRILGIEIGADDYMTKPFSAREVTTRVRALLRRASYAPMSRDRPKLYRFEGWRIDPLRRQVHDPSNARVPMTTHEFDLLLAFCRNPGRVLTREQLLAVSHAGLAGPIERSVDVHMSRLRKKFEKDAKDPVFFKTVRLGGYMLTALVEET